MTKEERNRINAEIKRLDVAIKKHTNLARWGNVESRERLRTLRQDKRELVASLKEN